MIDYRGRVKTSMKSFVSRAHANQRAWSVEKRIAHVEKRIVHWLTYSAW